MIHLSKFYIVLIFTVFSYYRSYSQYLDSLVPTNGQNVGDINYLPMVDDLHFETGHLSNIYQYYAVNGGYKGGRKQIINEFRKCFNDDHFFFGAQNSGYITIRFIVNYKGNTGRFRILQTDKDLKTSYFSLSSIQKLYEFTRDLKEWKIILNRGKGVNYYQYLTFVVDYGKVVDILP